MRLTIPLPGVRKSGTKGEVVEQDVEVAMSADGPFLHFNVPSVNRASAVDFKITREALDAALQTFDRAAPTDTPQDENPDHEPRPRVK